MVTVPVRGIRLHPPGFQPMPEMATVTVPVRGIRLHLQLADEIAAWEQLLSP